MHANNLECFAALYDIYSHNLCKYEPSKIDVGKMAVV